MLDDPNAADLSAPWVRRVDAIPLHFTTVIKPAEAFLPMSLLGVCLHTRITGISQITDLALVIGTADIECPEAQQRDALQGNESVQLQAMQRVLRVRLCQIGAQKGAYRPGKVVSTRKTREQENLFFALLSNS